jgi:hypothetical protein
MDTKLIYRKTAAGEEAMRQRTRVVQRNVRMVLILVDGQASVADLCAKTGNRLLTESALCELEHGGFVEPSMEADSVWEQSRIVAQEIKSAAMDKVSRFSIFGDKNEAARENPSLPFSSAQSPPAAARTQASNSTYSPSSTAAAASHDVLDIDRVSVVGAAGLPASPRRTMRSDQAVQRGWSATLKAFFLGGIGKSAGEDLKLPPIRYGGERHRISRSAVLIYCVLGLLVAGALATVLFPYDRYLREVEVVLGQLSGRPVKVGEMRMSIYPKLGLLLANVRLGNREYGQEIRISELRLQPVFGTLMAPREVFREVELSGATLPAEAVADFLGIFEAAAQSSSKIGVRHVTLDKVAVSFRGIGFSGLEGEVKLASDGRLESLSLRSADRSLQINAKPLAKGLNVQLEGLGWRPSESSRFLFDSASVKGVLEGATFTLGRLELRIFDGLVQGRAVLRADRQPSIAGDIAFERVNAKRLGTALGIGPQVAGEMAGKMKFSATADAWPLVFSAVNADGEFRLLHGSIGAVDLAEAVRRASPDATRGGVSPFELLSGKLRLSPASNRFSGLVMTSGLMQTTGQVEVSKGLQVSGRVDVQMHGTVNQLSMPVSISGPLAAPVLQAGRR